MRKLVARGITDWETAIAQQGNIPFGKRLRQEIVAELMRCQQAVEATDLHYLTKAFDPTDQWRILGHFFERASFFDIETTGLSKFDTITSIICLHKGQLHCFHEYENLDDFLTLLDDVELLVSFNGSSFDIPRVVDAFRIPGSPCPHVDMRWLCYHCAYKGGLKAIAYHMGFTPPADVLEVNGEDAIALWNQWVCNRDLDAKTTLTRYCASDVILLYHIAVYALREKGYPLAQAQGNDLWSALDTLA